MTERHYKAFISYSHDDEPWARWLHRSLESYPIPRNLVGTATAAGTIPKRFQPIFRDRDDLSTAADLPGKVKQALLDSEALIVICSPAAVASHWVNEEIREFRRLGHGDRIFAVIVDGDPQGREETNCFPPALVELSDGSVSEPLAADARKWADGRLLAKLKLLSGMLDIPLDSLRRRDLQRRQRIWIFTTISAVAVAFIVTLAVTFRIAAENRRASAEELVGFKLSESSSLLETPEPGAALARLSEWSPQELGDMLSQAGETDSERVRFALERRSEGRTLRSGGNGPEAMRKFRQSWAVLAEHYQRNRTSREALYQLGQAEYWIGQLELEAGNTVAAERSFLIYADISASLLRSDPEDAQSVLEMTYALSNLGDLELRRENADAETAKRFLQSALEYNQIALVLDPWNDDYRTELEQSHAFLADAQMQVCDLDGAHHSRRESTRLARQFFQTSTEEVGRQERLANALGGLAVVQQGIGLVDQALASLEESMSLLQEAINRQPEKTYLQAFLMERKSRHLHLLALSDETEAARELAADLQGEWQALFASNPNTDIEIHAHFGAFLLTREIIERDSERPAEADRTLEQAMEFLADLILQAPDLSLLRRLLSIAVLRYSQLNETLPRAEIVGLVPDLISDNRRHTFCELSALAAQQAVQRGELQKAERYTSYLLDKGYFEPGFIRFCRSQGLCPDH